METKRRSPFNLFTVLALILVAIGLWQTYGTLLMNKDTVLALTQDAVQLDTKSVVAKVRERTGKPTLVYFYASWCNACRLVTPLLASYAKQRRLDDFRLVFIAYDRDAYTLATHLARKGYDGLWTPYFKPSDPAAELQELAPETTAGIPTLMLFDTRGKLLTAHQGTLRGEALDAMLNKAKEP